MQISKIFHDIVEILKKISNHQLIIKRKMFMYIKLGITKIRLVRFWISHVYLRCIISQS